MDYLWQHPDWPNFQYDFQAVHGLLYRYAIESSQLAETVGRFKKNSTKSSVNDHKSTN